ncbi:LamB/YcsF family protein [Micropruina sp.]|uniref:LamB/YcsF family protein n=1 Tax=Micropruina sp. TaxID=2737536 RepID=UPI0039E6FE09
MGPVNVGSSIDLNSDVGESFGAWSMGDDSAMLKLVSSVNVACGFHAGDPSTARRICRTAAATGVAVGAHVSYRDLAGFGRRFVDVDPVTLADEVLYQVGALQAIARAEGTRVSYVKPHGALYNTIVHHEVQARAVVDGVVAAADHLAVLGLPGSAFLAFAGERGLRTVTEGFVDRGYRADGTLVPRSQPGAVLHDPAAVAERAVLMAAGDVVADDGSLIAVQVQSLCVHGDTPGAVELARAVRAALEATSTAIEPFATHESEA